MKPDVVAAMYIFFVKLFLMHLSNQADVAATLFGTTLVMAVYAPDSSKVWTCMVPASRTSRKFHDKDVGLDLKNSVSHVISELEGMCGPLCWQGYDKDPGGFKKLMW